MENAFTFESELDERRESELSERLRAHNREHSPNYKETWEGPSQAEPINLFVIDSSQRLVGGLIGRTNAVRCWLEVTVIWVDELHRGSDFGRSLMARAEKEARKRGCLYARLATSDHQAPGFYEKCGYERYGELKNCPPGETVFYYRKDL